MRALPRGRSAGGEGSHKSILRPDAPPFRSESVEVASRYRRPSRQRRSTPRPSIRTRQFPCRGREATEISRVPRWCLILVDSQSQPISPNCHTNMYLCIRYLTHLCIDKPLCCWVKFQLQLHSLLLTTLARNIVSDVQEMRWALGRSSDRLNAQERAIQLHGCREPATISCRSRIRPSQSSPGGEGKGADQRHSSSTLVSPASRPSLTSFARASSRSRSLSSRLTWFISTPSTSSRLIPRSARPTLTSFAVEDTSSRA